MSSRHRGLGLGLPVSHICAFTVFPSTLMDRVANSTPMVDLDSRLNSLRVKRESTVHRRQKRYVAGDAHVSGPQLSSVARPVRTVTGTGDPC